MKLPGIPQELGHNLVVRACTNPADIERVAALNGEIHGQEVVEAIRYWLLQGHPQLDPAGWLFVEDAASGDAQRVATLALMPLTWRYGPVSLPVAELGFVATRPEYRRRGLQRVLSAAFDRIALANGFTLAAIEGIPYFYRQFGYEYALPLFDARFLLRPEQIPAAESEAYSFRPAAPADVPFMMACFERQNAYLTITTERSEAMWHHYLRMQAAGLPALAQAGELSGLRLHVVQRHGEPAGYLALMPSGWANRLNVMELAVESARGVAAALGFARAQAEAADHAEVGLQLPADHPACAQARQLGIKEEGTYGWQIKILDPAGFLNAIAPALEARLAAAGMAVSNGELAFDLYRQKVGLRIESGRVSASPLAPMAETHASMPPFVATQLWLGWKPFAALDDWYKDAWARPEQHELIDILFPPAAAHIHLGY